MKAVFKSKSKPNFMRRILLFLMPMIVAWQVFAQERTINGRVTSEDGSPVPGANVVVKGTSIGTVTDANGNYRLSGIPPGGGTLQISFIGFKTTEVVIGDRATIDVILQTDVTQLSEVVVTALGLETSSEKLGTATSKVIGNAVQQSGEPGLIQGLSGKASGVLIQKTSGDPGAGAYIQIRGQSTITSSVQPLIVVDGVPIFNSTLGSSVAGVVEQSRLNDLNPNDIESIQILKGASAAALWGSRAANGVLLITTKKGISGRDKKMTVTYGVTYSIDQISYRHKLQEKFGKGLNGVWSASSAGSQAGSWGDKIADRSGDPDEVNTSGAYFEAEDGTLYYPVITKNDRTSYEQSNFDAIFQNGSFLEQNISISSGSERGSLFVSYSNLDQEGIIRNNSDYKRNTFRINLTNNLAEQVKLSTNFTYSKINSNRIQQGSNLSGLYLGFLRTPADFDIRDYKGTYYDAAGTPYFGRHRSYRNQLGASTNPIYDNPLWVINEHKNTSQVDRFIGSFELEIKPTSWLKFIARPGVDFYEDRRLEFLPVFSGSNPTGFATEQYISERQLNIDAFGVADFKLSDKITGTALLGMNFNQRDFTNLGGSYQNFILDLPISNFSNATTTNRFPFDFESLIRTSAGYGTLNVGYGNLLYLNATLRAEAASTFGREANSLFMYPSTDLAFNFTELPGLQGNYFLSSGKLRAAYGEVGIQPAPYRTVDDFIVAAFFEGWGPAVSSAAYSGSYSRDFVQGNRRLEPERKKETEFGFDLGLLNNRATLNFTYYYNKTQGALFDVAIAPSTGYTNRYANAASLENKGIEVDLGFNILKIGDFSWDLSANFNRNRNKVLDLAGTESLFLAGFTGASSRAVVGQPIGVLWGGRFARDSEGNLILNADGFPTVAATEGIIGDPNPDWRGGLGSTFKFKNLRLYALFETFQGGDIWTGTHGALHTFGRALPTANETTVTAAEAATLKTYDGQTVVDIGTNNGDGTYTFRGNIHDFGGGNVALTQAWYRDLGGGFGPVAEQFVVDGSWTRLRELTLAYTLKSESFRKATKLNSIDFILTGRNLAIWAPSKLQIGVDPETNLTGPSNGRGLEYFNNPGTKSFLFSIRITY